MKMQGADFFFFFNHSERLSRWPPKQGVLMLMFPCQIAGLQIKLYIQQTFHYESTQYTTAVVFFIYEVYGFKTNLLQVLL